MKVPTAVAMTFAGVDRGRFNEAVWAGYYRCAPETREGASRYFDEADLVGLSAFGFLLKQGIKPQTAGHLACYTAQQLRACDDLHAVYSLTVFDHRDYPGIWSTHTLPYYGEDDTSLRGSYRPAPAGQPRPNEIRIDVLWIRQQIRESDLLRDYL